MCGGPTGKRRARARTHARTQQAMGTRTIPSHPVGCLAALRRRHPRGLPGAHRPFGLVGWLVWLVTFHTLRTWTGFASFALTGGRGMDMGISWANPIERSLA